MERIDEDLDLHAKKKKLLRLADAEFLAGQTPDLPKLQLQLRELKIDDIELETGRPRTEAYIVYLFLMLRGFNGGCKDQHARLLLQESITLRLWLEHLGLELPPASTLSDNLNAVSNQTRSLIHQVQLRFIVPRGLDDLHRVDLPDMNQLGLLEQQEELRQLEQNSRHASHKGPKSRAN